MDSNEDYEHVEPEAWQRSHLGYTERFVDDFHLPLSNGKSLRLTQAPKVAKPGQGRAEQDDRGYDPGITGTTVWDAGIVLAQYLSVNSPNSRAIFQAPGLSCALELGSGTGLVSLAVASAWAVPCLVASDIASMVPLINKNLALNRPLIKLGARVHVHPLRWGEPSDLRRIAPLDRPCSLVFGSDLIYSDAIDQSSLLLSTLGLVCDNATVAVFAMHRLHQPARVDAFIAALSTRLRDVRVIPLEEQPAAWRTEQVVLVEARGWAADVPP
jgi:predicted nicotinamide N-methyase